MITQLKKIYDICIVGIYSDYHIIINMCQLTIKYITVPNIQIQIQIILLHYNVLHGQTEFDPSYGNP